MCACTPDGERSKTRNVIFFMFSPGDPPCENATILNKSTKLKTWRVFAWRPFALPGENTTDGRRKLATYKCVVSYIQAKIGQTGGGKATHEVSFFRVARRKAVTRKHEKVTI